jgi:hypothetical protein
MHQLMTKPNAKKSHATREPLFHKLTFAERFHRYSAYSVWVIAMMSFVGLPCIIWLLALFFATPSFIPSTARCINERYQLHAC